MRILILMACVTIVACSSKPILPNTADFYGQNVNQVATHFENMGLKCEKGDFSYPIDSIKKDLLCTYLEKAWICPERYKIIMTYHADSEIVSGSAHIDRRKLCF